MGKHCLVGSLHIIEEYGHFLCRISLCYIGNVDATGGVSRLLNHVVRCDIVLADMPYQYVGRHNLMG